VQACENFLGQIQVGKLYQRVTDNAFELLIQKNVPSESYRITEQSEEQQKLTFEEENA